MNFIIFKRPLLYVLLVLVMFLLQSCNGDYCSQMKNKINDKYQQEGLKEEIVLDLNKVFDFEWDVLYVCGPYGFEQEISNSIGFESQYDYVSEGETLFSFIKNNEVIEERLINCNGIAFVSENKGNSECIVIKSTSAKFKVKNLTKGGQNYILRKIN